VFFRLSSGAVVVLFLCCNLPVHCQQSFAAASSRENASSLNSGATTRFSAEEVAKNLEQRDEERAAALTQVSSQRVYHMHYRGFAGDYEAEMVVEVTYRPPNIKQFRVISQSGSSFVINHIFNRLMQSEREYVSDPQVAALNTENYKFSAAGYDSSPDGDEYVLNLSPKRKNKFLYRGKIWVDAKDFAVVRIEAEPSQNPSLWIKKTEIEHEYKKLDGFWLPAWDHTESEMRFGGEATLSIEYKDYQITKAAQGHDIESARAGSR
jgi:outer membrane lipoprotein-sorting protein